MPYSTPQLYAADAVAAFLRTKTVAGYALSSARSSDQLPQYDPDKGDLRTLRVDVVAATPFSFLTTSPLNRGAVEEECPVTVAVQTLCDDGNHDLYRRLKALLRGIGYLLAFEPIAGFGRPREDMVATERPDMVEHGGVFFGRIDAVYRAFTEAPA